MCKVKTKRIISAITVCLLCTAAVDQSSFSGEVLSAEDGGSGTVITSAGSGLSEGLYTIRNINSGKYLSQRYGNVLQLSTPAAWRAFSQPDGTVVFTYGSDYALTVECGTGADGNNISLQRTDGSESQKFRLKQIDGNTYALLTAVSGGESAVDVYNISKDDVANICQWDYWGGEGQHFVLEAVSEPLDNNNEIRLPVELSVSKNTNPFAGNITKQNDRYNYGGDPAAFVDGDTVYAYTGHDISTNAEVNNAIYNIPEYLCYSTKDLINWKYEGVVMKMSDVSWGDAKSAWAAQVLKHNGKYYLYFCSWDRTSEGKQSIGVAVSDSPKGPFRDIGHPLVKGTLTNDQSSNWDDNDPTVWVDKDKNGEEHRYLAWGNSRYYICELNDDMISVKDLNGDKKITFGGEGTKGDVFYRGTGLNMYTEAPWLYRRQREDGTYYGDYYLIYAYRWREQMAYSTCTDLLRGDWKFGGLIFEANATSNTNHSGFFDFRGKTYMIYHNGALPEVNGYRRCPNICEVRFDSSGRIMKMEETTAGIGGTVSKITDHNGNMLGHASFVNSINDKDYPYANVQLGSKLKNLTEHDTDWVIVPGVSNVEEPSYVSIESENKTGLFVTAGNNGSSAVLSQITELDENDLKRATFRTIEGLSDTAKVSFESVSAPGTYLTFTESGDIKMTDGSDPAACTFDISPEGIIPSVIKGDVNADGSFDIADLVLMQKWFFADADADIKNRQAGDLSEDNRLDILDLICMKNALINENPQ